jgi:O-antigen ligase
VTIIQDTKEFIGKLTKQDAAFYAAAAYLVIEYVRPHTLFPAIDVLPWTPLVLLVGLVSIFMRGNVKIQTTHVLIFLFMCVAWASCFVSYDPEASFKMINVIISWVVISFVFTNAVKNLEQYKLLLIIFFLCIFKMSLFGARTWAMRGFGFTEWGIAGPVGWFQNSGELALIMVVFSAMSYGYIISNNIKSKLYYLAPITAAMTVIAASSRGSQLALAAIGILAALIIGKLKLKNLLIFAFVGWLGFTFLPEEQKERFSTMGSDGTSESRLMYWEKGIEMMNDHKLLGVGYYAFAEYFSINYAPYITFENFVYRREVAHNTLVQVGSEMGYSGLFVYLLMLIHCARLTRQTRILAKQNPTIEKINWIAKYTICADLAVIGYLIGSFFMSVAFYPYIYLFLMLNQCLLNATKNEVEKKQFIQQPIQTHKS